MIDYQTFHQIRHLRDEEHLSAAQIAQSLALDERTVSKWIDVEKYQPRKTGKRQSKLDPFKSTIVRLLAQHPYTAQQLLQRLKEGGYAGGYSILKAFVQHVRPTAAPAFLTLHFAPGQTAQVDWGSAGVLPVGHTRRQLSFFVMVLCYSRRLYVEFTLAQTQEHFLACHQHAFEYFNGVTSEVMVDNCKTAVLSHPYGQPAVPHPRYLAYEACLRGHSVLFTTAVDIINTLSAAQTVGRLKNELKRYLKPTILAVDELGYLPIDMPGADLLFQVISQRYEHGSIVLTTNQPYKHWPKIFNNDSTLTSAVLDRLLHHAETVIIEGKSYRMKDQIETP